MGQNTIKINHATVTVNGNPPANPLNNGDYIETNASGSADVMSDASKAATVFGQGPTNIYVFPPSTLTRVYYNNSYRYQLNTPNGYVGIRG